MTLPILLLVAAPHLQDAGGDLLRLAVEGTVAPAPALDREGWAELETEDLEEPPFAGADFDGDGRLDVYLPEGAPGWSCSMPELPRRMRVLSGRTLETIGRVEADVGFEARYEPRVGWLLRHEHSPTYALQCRPSLQGPVAWRTEDPARWRPGDREPLPPYRAEVVPDVDGDGIAEVAFGDPWFGWWTKVGDEPRAGAVELRSGRDGAVLWRHVPARCYGDFGLSLAPAGDRDGDGRGDLAVLHREGMSRERVLVLSGRDGSVVLETDLPPQLAGGHGLLPLGDLDGDGLLELGLRPEYADAKACVLLSRSAAVVPLDPEGEVLALADAGDTDGDGRGELLLLRLAGEDERPRLSRWKSGALEEVGPVPARDGRFRLWVRKGGSGDPARVFLLHRSRSSLRWKLFVREL